MTCQCGRIVDFLVLPTGFVVESCACGKQRALRGRTVEDIAREEAEFEARCIAEMPAVTNRQEQRPCEWPLGCSGFATRISTNYCPAHCDDRRRTKHRDVMRERQRKRNKHPRSESSHAVR